MKTLDGEGTSNVQRPTPNVQRGRKSGTAGGRSLPAAGEAEKAKGERLNYELRFALVTKPSGRVLMTYFRGPKDAEGVQIRLAPRERAHLVSALTNEGFHQVVRDDEAELQREMFDTAKDARGAKEGGGR